MEEAIVFAYTHKSADVIGIDDERVTELLDFADAEKLRAAGDPLPSELHSGVFTVYRGEADPERNGRGLSWTPDFSNARFYAERQTHNPLTDVENPVPVVFRMEITADQILFYNKDEHEVVVRLDENVQPEQIWSLPDEDEAI